MRNSILVAALSLAALDPAASAQDPQQPAGQQPPLQQQQPAQQYPGPISGGVYRQPTEAEIQQREHDNRAAEEQAKQQNQEVEQLYKQLINPQPGQPQ